jgi:hypothetical protein
VIRDPRTASGWRFRSSYAEGLDALERAFHLLPSIHRSFSSGSFEDLRSIFKTRSDAVRPGLATPPDTTRFLAYPSWIGDSLTFIPLPASAVRGLHRGSRSSADVNLALQHQRRRFFQLATMWRAALPNSADALEAVAVSLELLGDASALDTLHAARTLASDIAFRVRLGVTDVWMRVLRATPGKAEELRAARVLADSLLAMPEASDPRSAALLASLAALTGRATLAARLARVAERGRVPVPAGDAAPALLTFAALGGPAESLRTLESAVRRSIEQDLTAAEANAVQNGWLARAAPLAIPQYDFQSVVTQSFPGYRMKMLGAWRSQNAVDAQAILAEVSEERRRGGIQAADVAPDGLYVEAAVLADLGDIAGANAWLRPTLDSLFLIPSHSLGSVARAGAFMRCLVLRAELEARLGNAQAARQWSIPVTIMWSDADEFLKPAVARMRALARSG